MLIILIVGLIILAYFLFKATRFGELRGAEAAIMAIFSIGLTAYFILFVVTGV